jgi:hypothetical protein
MRLIAEPVERRVTSEASQKVEALLFIQKIDRFPLKKVHRCPSNIDRTPSILIVFQSIRVRYPQM